MNTNDADGRTQNPSPKTGTGITELRRLIGQLGVLQRQADEGKVSPLGAGRLREGLLSKGLRILAAEAGIELREPLQINANGEYAVIAEMTDPSLRSMGASGPYGAAFAALLRRFDTRTGQFAVKGHVLPENGWCWMNHFEVERMLTSLAQEGLESLSLRPMTPAELQAIKVRGTSLVCVEHPEWGTWGVMEDRGSYFEIHGDAGGRVLDKAEALGHWAISRPAVIQTDEEESAGVKV